MAKKKTIEEILGEEGISESELKAILKSAKHKPSKGVKLGISGKHFKYGYFSDAHIGHEKFREDLWDYMVKYFKKEDVEFVLDMGDHLEGMSGRPGHIYELSHIGFDKQINYAADLFNQIKQPIYGIDGNHDLWYKIKNNGGVSVGNALESMVENYTHCGEYEADLQPDRNTSIKMFHPGDGSAYAISYKLQKLIESLDGGDKPDIVHEGHYHKALYMFVRNVHGFESGTMCGQSGWMRGKKIPAHVGFGVVDVYTNKNGVDRLKHEFIPGY